MSEQKKKDSKSPVFYLNLILAICVIVLGIVYQFFLKETDDLSASDGINAETFDDAPLYPLFTAEELMQYDGENKPKLYLAIMGDIFDVSRGDKHYGKGQAYNAFVARDISRAFVTGEFDVKSTKDSLDHVLSLTPSELVNLKKWRDFYKDNYEFVGRMIGRFYEDNGEPTEYFWQIERKIQFGLKQLAEERSMKNVFPPCNIEYKNSVTRFWCTKGSGGIERDWAGYPVQMFDQDSKSYTCVCLEKDRFDLPQLRQYERCEDHERSCWKDEEQNDNVDE